MLSREDNDLLTRVEGDAPMGRMLRDSYWMPFLRSQRLERDGAPVRVRLLGHNYVAYRASDGRVGFLDEHCPHRGASLLLARNEDCALRCIFHGWKIDVSGTVVETPNEGNNPERFAASVPVRWFPVREAGGLLWVWLGERDKPAKFPDFEFTALPEDHLFTSYTPIDCNWLQGVEATLDSAHVGLLHQSWASRKLGKSQLMNQSLAPRYEFAKRPYGMCAAALRTMEDGSCYARVGEFVMPFYMFVGTSNVEAGDRLLFISVPVDDTHSILFFIRYSLADRGPITTGAGFPLPEGVDFDHFAPLNGDATNAWGQDRDAMKAGHFTGFTDNLIKEDVVVQVSMGPIADRSKEFLSSSDLAVVHGRRLLLDALRGWQKGIRPMGTDSAIEFDKIRADAGIIPAGANWRERFGNVPSAEVAAE
jgi:phthalate 4,5-dioxygenase oxygenase subunit